MAPRKKTTMSDDHKAALAEGRTQGRAVRLYLEALESTKPKPGRKRTPGSISKRIEAIEASFEDATPMGRLELVQEKIDLQRQLEDLEDDGDLSALEADFIQAAAPYAERKGISYAAFRAVGVPAATLKAAGMSRAS